MIITLSKEALKYLDDKIIQIEIDEEVLLKSNLKQRLNIAKGILKNHLVDGLDYQLKIRKEFDRKIDVE
ncbi:MAG: hypothetical protein NZM09_04735 [Ignavibacterium sp.]|nr:hypothetical protein [Ignavibacterium sp.]MDW8374982.1 hypothetical protein [Ignavibacteriales bacterium]